MRHPYMLWFSTHTYVCSTQSHSHIRHINYSWDDTGKNAAPNHMIGLWAGGAFRSFIKKATLRAPQKEGLFLTRDLSLVLVSAVQVSTYTTFSADHKVEEITKNKQYMEHFFIIDDGLRICVKMFKRKIMKWKLAEASKKVIFSKSQRCH